MGAKCKGGIVKQIVKQVEVARVKQVSGSVGFVRLEKGCLLLSERQTAVRTCGSEKE